MKRHIETEANNYHGKSYAEQLRLASLFTNKVTSQVINEDRFYQGSHGLDAGCGIGQHTMLLAEKVGSDGSVDGLDLRSEHITEASKSLQENPVRKRVNFHEGSIFDLPFKNNTFDWVWCADTMWPGVIPDPVNGIAELKRVTKPGGFISILFWSNHMFLPGHPVLEARLNVIFNETTPHLSSVEAHMHFTRALGWLKSAGLQAVSAKNYTTSVHGPMNNELLSSINFLIDMLYGGMHDKLEKVESAKYLELTNPDSNDYILNLDDYFCFVDYACFTGKLP